jgi:hypothetical protein
MKYKMKQILLTLMLISLSFTGQASGSGQTIHQIYYCGEDFAMKMSGGDWYVVQKSRVGEKKLAHFLSMALFMMASDKKTANVFPGDPLENWCGNSGFLPITIFSISN